MEELLYWEKTLAEFEALAPRNRSGPCYARALLLDTEAISPEAISHQPLAEVIKEYGPSLAPIHAFPQGILSLVADDSLPVPRNYDL